MKSQILTVCLHLVVYQEKSIFGGIFKMPQKPTQEDGSDREVMLSWKDCIKNQLWLRWRWHDFVLHIQGSSQHEHNISASCENLSTQKVIWVQIFINKQEKYLLSLNYAWSLVKRKTIYSWQMYEIWLIKKFDLLRRTFFPINIISSTDTRTHMSNHQK